MGVYSFATGGTGLYPSGYWTVGGGLLISTPEQGAERRANLVLRALIDEMLDRVRELNGASSSMTADERARAEAELESIMARVRRYAALRDQATS